MVHSPHHLDPGERGMSSGRTPWGALAHLVDEDLGECYQARKVLTVDVEGALLRDKMLDEPLDWIAVTYCFRYCLVLALGRSK